MADPIQCKTGKIGYASSSAAQRENTALRKKGRELSAFVCQFCGCWHLGRKRDTKPALKAVGTRRGR